MNREEFEAKVLNLWMTTRIPLTRANLQFLTGEPRKRLDGWLDELARDGVVDFDADDEGELVYKVKGATRATRGPSTPAEYASGSKGGGVDTLALAARTAGLAGRGMGDLTKSQIDKPKSMATSGVAGLLAGPAGLLYSAPFKHAVPAAAGWLFLIWLLPFSWIIPLAIIVNPISAIAALGYTWRFNQTGERTPLLPEKKK